MPEEKQRKSMRTSEFPSMTESELPREDNGGRVNAE